jgi:hypothetical protein
MSIKYTPKYDFSNQGIDWEDYEKDVRLRTDAVWERGKLKDYFRLFYKIFYWDPRSKEYYITMPQHSNINVPDNWRFRVHKGYNPTGKTNSFERRYAAEYQHRTAGLNLSDHLRDKNVLCYYRFRTYKKCEENSIYAQIKELDEPDGSPEKVNYACYQEMMELTHWCSQQQINWLADLWHHMELQHDPTVFGRNIDIKMTGDEFDNPEHDMLTY